MGFEEITTEDFIEESENTEEVAEPLEEPTEVEGEKESEAAEQTPKQDDATNSAFAELRRAKESAERELAELKAKAEEEARSREARERAIADLTGDDSDAVIKALAEVNGMSVEEVEAQIQAEEEAYQKDLLIENLQRQIEEQQKVLSEAEAERMIVSDLAEIQKIDPSIKSLADIPEGYEAYRFATLPDGSQLTATQAYAALKAEKEATQIKPPKEIGKLKPTEVEKDYFTEEEVYSMTSEEREANYEKIFASMKHWKK